MYIKIIISYVNILKSYCMFMLVENHIKISNMIIKMIKAILQRSDSLIQEEQNSPKVFNN